MDLRDRIRPLFSTHGKLDVMSYGKYVLMAFLLFFANFLVGTVLFSGMAAALAALGAPVLLAWLPILVGMPFMLAAVISWWGIVLAATVRFIRFLRDDLCPTRQ
jgi:hypothetical protein